MWRDPPVLYTKLMPPQPPRHTLVRTRIEHILRDALDYRVTIVQASTGYGKSTALASLTRFPEPLFWYTAGEGDSDPQQFLAHLVHAFRIQQTIPETPLALLQERGATASVCDALLNELALALKTPARFVIDDYHFAASHEIDALLEHFIAFLPPPPCMSLSRRGIRPNGPALRRGARADR